MISLRNVSFGFEPGVPVFDGFTLNLTSGQTTAILGPSGSGKSTLIRLITGLLEPSAGSIVLGGNEPITAGKIRGVLFQDDTLVPWLTTFDNAVFPKTGHNADAKLRASASARLAAVGLEDALTKLPSELSTGMKKRLEFVRAVANDRSYLIADEPFSGLDIHQKRALWALWREEMAVRPRTAVLVTHDPLEAIALADRVVVMSGTRPITSRLDVDNKPGVDDAILERRIISALMKGGE